MRGRRRRKMAREGDRVQGGDLPSAREGGDGAFGREAPDGLACAG